MFHIRRFHFQVLLNESVFFFAQISSITPRKSINNIKSTEYCDFLGINSCCVWDKFILGTTEQTTKISKTSLTKIGHTAVPIGLGFQVEKLIVTNLKVGKKMFPCSCLDFFHQNHQIGNTKV